MDSRSAALPTPYQQLMRDVTVVKQYVHDRTDEEIFAYLEAHYNDFNRVEKVVHELRGRNDVFVAQDEQNVRSFNSVQSESGHEETLEQIDLNNDQVQSLLGIKQCCWTQACNCWNARETFPPLYNNPPETGQSAPAYNNARHTGAPVYNNVRDTGTFSPAQNNAQKTGVYNNQRETTFPPVYNNARQTGTFSPVYNNSARDTGSFSPVYNNNARETGTFSPVYNNTARETGTFSPVYNNNARETGRFSPAYSNNVRETGAFSPVYLEPGACSGSGSMFSDEKFKAYHDDRLKTLLEILPDGDPDFFSNFIQTNRGNETFINESVSSWLQKRNYKKVQENKPQENGKVKNKFVDGDMSVEEFLEIFPDPETHFNKPKMVVSKNYQKHVLVYANNTYSLNDSHIVQILFKHRYSLIPVVREMKCFEPTMKRVKREVREMPKEIEQVFYEELVYLKLADEIAEYQRRKKEERRKRVDEAKANGCLMTCECCFEDELLVDDMFPCPKDHLFCRDCICRQAEINIGANKLQFPCFNGYCKEQFSMKVLQSCLRANIFSNILRKVQEEEIRRAEIADLVSCPFCSFSAIMPDRNNKVFKCLNPECRKTTCRLCKELDHVPLRCHEVEKKPEVVMRTFIENKMSEALLRTCPKCKCRLIKYEGCNRITCTCGQMMCYLCRQPIEGYSHFEENGNPNSKKCPITSNVMELHRKELKMSAEAARREYIQTHPEFANMVLKHDPTKHISTQQPNLRQPNLRLHNLKPINMRLTVPDRQPYHPYPGNSWNRQPNPPNMFPRMKQEAPPSPRMDNFNQVFVRPVQRTHTVNATTTNAIHSSSPPPYNNNNNNNTNNNANLAGNYSTNNLNYVRNYQSNNTNLKRTYPSTATCPSTMPLDHFSNSNISIQPSTSQAALFSSKLVGGKDANHEQASGIYAAFRQTGDQSPSFPLLTSLLSPDSPSSSRSSPNIERNFAVDNRFLF